MGDTMGTAALQLMEKSYEFGGRIFVAKALKMGDQDFMTTGQAAEALGLTEAGLRSVIRDHSLVVRNAHDQLEQLRALGVIPLRTTVANLLPKATISALIKILGTAQAWAAYNALWYEAVSAGDRYITTVELKAVRREITARARLFDNQPYVRGAIARDIRWVFHGRDIFNSMGLKDLSGDSLDRVLEFVRTWTKQHSPLTPRQERTLSGWISAVTKEARPTADAELLASLLEEEIYE